MGQHTSDITRVFTLIILCIFGCNNPNYKTTRTDKYQNMIVGDWNQIYSEKGQIITVGDIFMRDPYHLFRYTFYPNDTLENHLGFLKGRSEYLGNFATYKIDDDSLFIKKPTSEVWDKIKLLHLSDVSMVWKYPDGEIVLFERLQNEQNYNIKVDSVIFSYSSYCFSKTCLDYILQVNSNGNVKYKGGRNMDKIGYYKGKISLPHVDYLFNKFSVFDVNRLKEFYKDPDLYSEGSLIQAAIYYDDTVKNVAIYDGYIPAGLAHALIPLHILYKTIPLNKVDSMKADQWFDEFHPFSLKEFFKKYDKQN